jgi:hypothetical protein
MKITVGANPIRVRSIGRMYLNGNSQSHAVKIIRASDNVVVANTTVTMNNWDHGQFKYATLSSPVDLLASTSYYVVSQETSAGDRWYDSNSTVTAGAGVTINNAILSANDTTWSNPSGSVQPYGPVDFVYETILSTPFITNTTLVTQRNNLSGWVGMKFTTGTQPVKISSLGRMSVTGNTQTHTLKVVRASDSVAVATTSVSMSGSTAGQFKYAALAAPVTLTANTAYYAVSQETNAGDKWYDSDTAVTSTNVATVNNAVSSLNGTTWTNLTTAQRSFGPVNLKYGDW